MPDDRKETPYQHSQNGLLISGMTTHYPSDVFLFYPPDSIGGRPSEYTILQNVSPTHRDSQESFRALQQQQYDEANRRRARQAEASLHDRAIPQETQSSQQSGSQPRQQVPRSRISGDGARREHESPQQSIRRSVPQISHSTPAIDIKRPPRRQSTIVWTCCHNCSDPGPYSSLYPNCMGCEMPRCSRCPETVLSPQDRTPSV